ncbi:Cell shape-determining protein MreC [Phycisphaerae bacterium RAS1]|nr:Cell shape-determining protein MreC [Phycisphaerae bacterium RAS1]
MPVHSRLTTKQGLFTILMFGAAVAALMPGAVSGWVRRFFQPLAWFEAPITGVSQAISGQRGPPLTAEEAARLRVENEELRRLLGQQGLRVDDLENRLADITGLRSQLSDASAKIIIAAVMAYDGDPNRETLKIAKGSVAGLRKGQWVAAGVDAARRDPAETGRDLLMRQWLVGRVVAVEPYVGRVQLSTDPQFREPVIVAGAGADGRWKLGEERCFLRGKAHGRMEISQARRDYVAAGETLVVCPPSADLPLHLSIGQMIRSRPLDASPLHFDIEVRPWRAWQELSYVYVIAVGN